MRLLSTLLLLTIATVPTAADDLLLERLERDPRWRSDVVVRGDALQRLDYRHDAPRFPGDAPGSLVARYDASLPPGLFGFALPQPWGADAAFAGAFVWEISGDGFFADPNGFFQISFGLFNGETTGLERTGDLDDFFVDSFDLIELDYFPNVSPFFGGPFVSPTLFGSADTSNPAFPFSGAVANGAFFFGPPAELPFDVPLVTLIASDPSGSTMTFTTWAIEAGALPRRLAAADATIDVSQLALERFEVDTIGLTLWRDGFAGETSSLTADVALHLVAATPVTDELKAMLAPLWPEVAESLP